MEYKGETDPTLKFEDKPVVLIDSISFPHDEFGNDTLTALNDHLDRYDTRQNFGLLSPEIRNKWEICIIKRQ